MKYIINIDLTNPINVSERENVYVDIDNGMTWTISKTGLQKLKPLKEMENNVPYMITIPDVIRRKEAIDALLKAEKELPYYDSAQVAINVIKKVPSAQDEIAKAVAAVIEQPEIIRCKDCKHNPKESWFGCPMSHLSEEQRPETAWCWKGERKDDGCLISRQAAIDDLHGKDPSQIWDTADIEVWINELPTAEPEWNNHTVACLLAELFGDSCACNYNGIDEWLPSKCELLDSCPNPVGVACWEQYLTHRAERRTDE